MTHVKIRSKSRGSYELLVDGVDLSMAVLANSLSITFPEEDPGLPNPAHVSFTIAADSLDMDLPSAVVSATAEPPTAGGVA